MLPHYCKSDRMLPYRQICATHSNCELLPLSFQQTIINIEILNIIVTKNKTTKAYLLYM